MSLWLVSVAMGNKLASFVTDLNSTKDAAGKTVRRIELSDEMLCYVGLMLVVAGIFAAIAVKFPEQTPQAAQST